MANEGSSTGLSLTELGTLLSQHNARKKTLYVQVLLSSNWPDGGQDIEPILQHCLEPKARSGKGIGYETGAARSRRHDDEDELRKRVFLRVLTSNTIIKKIEQFTGYRYL